MDPWNNLPHQQLSNLSYSIKSDNCFEFEDNFKPLVCDTLPDSKEYLASLEKKLAKLKSDPNVLQQLTAKREACMQQLLKNDYDSNVNDSLDTPIEHSTLLRTLAPERQALTQGERVTLIQYDQLIDNENDSKSERGSTASNV
ncbi:hypothetical protein RN001_013452 [Aquatica leii]|uniref:Uncharacterized protein n=1 Tax=Aquatica leii TaxID=1421715 RepID=A0AAN7P027_9COLE|nr:hypothetical protein RN001_013452 [Aquatica leii]